ncbi:hypothetical protein [Burkholderia ubonensis]|uniref:CIS tube protein n=1 Tax=Burkholderia ubonensis TaxID=101571 RepID=UPI0007563088|nr:hypothetical protein [Burkholderia ubonensis]KWN65854.1 hypothetical protein WM23_07650 [Burkholderia ubonensis]
MMPLGQSLARLTIEAFPIVQGKPQALAAGKVEAMYNPESVALGFRAKYPGTEIMNAPYTWLDFGGVELDTLVVDLIFDASLPRNPIPITEHLNDLHRLCCDIDQATQVPRSLKVTWGQMKWHGHDSFEGRMESMSVSYTLFDRDGTPLRATAKLSLKADPGQQLRKSAPGGMPKVGKITISDMATLPMLAMAAGLALPGGAGGIDYLTMAVTNGLDNLSELVSGDSLIALVEDVVESVESFGNEIVEAGERFKDAVVEGGQKVGQSIMDTRPLGSLGDGGA